MCARFALTHSTPAVAARFGLDDLEPFPPRYNIAPGQPILILHESDPSAGAGRASRRRAQLARWGLIPAWTKDPRDIPLLFNARSESAGERNSFKAALRYRRCVIPASGYYAWSTSPEGARQAFWLRAERGPVAFAGLWETYLAADGSEIDTATILTTAASTDLGAQSDRMPVVIAAGDEGRWLDCAQFAPSEVAELLRPAAAGSFAVVPVSDRINSVSNMGPDVQAPQPHD